MSYLSDENPLLLTDTAVEDLFICQYMTGLTMAAICIYLLLKMDGTGKYTEKEILERSVFEDQATKEAVAELIAAGLITKNRNNKFVFVDIKKVEVESYCASVIAKGGAELADLELSPLKKQRDNLCSSINKTIYAGKIGWNFYGVVDKCLYTYKFESIVIYRLFEEAKERKIQYNIHAVEKLAKEWDQKGIRTADKLDEVLNASKMTKELTDLVGKLTRKRANALDLERIEKWASLGVTPELAEFAFRSNEYRGVNTMNVDETLSNWIYAGVTTVEEATKYENERHKENSRKYKNSKKNGGFVGTSGGAAGIEYVGTEKKTEKPEKAESTHTNFFDMFEGEADEDN